MYKTRPRIVDLCDTEPNGKRGGSLHTMLTPLTVGSTSGFMGLAIMRPGERISEHYHPYSEEFVYVVNGRLEVDLDDETFPLRADQGLMIPKHMRHRFRNIGDEDARMVFHLSPLAPKPSLGHVDTETLEGSESLEPYPVVQEEDVRPERRGAPS